MLQSNSESVETNLTGWNWYTQTPFVKTCFHKLKINSIRGLNDSVETSFN